MDTYYRRLGLKGYLEETKGMYLHKRILKFFRELKYAWQRVYRGWDDVSTCDISSSFVSYLIGLLETYKDNHHCLFFCPDGYEIGLYDINSDRFLLTEEQTEVILDTLLFHLKMTDENYCEKKIYGSCCYDDDYKFKHDREYYSKLYNVMEQNKDAAMDLIKMFFYQLWD